MGNGDGIDCEWQGEWEQKGQQDYITGGEISDRFIFRRTFKHVKIIVQQLIKCVLYEYMYGMYTPPKLAAGTYDI